MTISSGNIASADEVMNAFGNIFKNQSQLIYNSKYVGWDSGLNFIGSPNLKNTVYEINQESIDSTNSNVSSRQIDANGSVVYFGTDYDVFDSSVSASLWSDVGVNTGTLSETTTYVQNTFATAISDITLRSHAINISPTTTTGQLIIKADLIGSSNSGASNQTSLIQLRDDSNNVVTLATRTGNFNGIFGFTLLMTRVDADTINVKSEITGYTGTIYSNSNINVTSLDNIGNWQLQARTSNTAGTVGSTTIKWYQMLYAMNSDIVSTEGDTYVTNTLDTSTTFTDAIATANNSTGSVLSITSNGSTYESITDTQIHRFSTTGTDLRFKTIASGIGLNSLITLNEYALWYNTGAA